MDIWVGILLPNLQDYQEVLVANCQKTRLWCCDELKEDMCDGIALMVETHHTTTAPSRTKELRARSLPGKFYPTHCIFIINPHICSIWERISRIELTVSWIKVTRELGTVYR